MAIAIFAPKLFHKIIVSSEYSTVHLVDGSWYRGKPLVGLKIAAIVPSTAIRNAKEFANDLSTFCGSKENVPPVLVIYTRWWT